MPTTLQETVDKLNNDAAEILANIEAKRDAGKYSAEALAAYDGAKREQARRAATTRVQKQLFCQLDESPARAIVLPYSRAVTVRAMFKSGAIKSYMSWKGGKWLVLGFGSYFPSIEAFRDSLQSQEKARR